MAKNKEHIVQKNDTLWGIAKKYNVPLSEIMKLNPGKGDIIQVGDSINLTPNTYKKVVDLRAEWEKEQHYKSNIDAIVNAYHDSNYVIVDKANRSLSVMSPSGELLYSTDKIATGKSGQDYNTITRTKDGKLINYAGNNSTPAGISVIEGVGTYHGHPSFQRSVRRKEGNSNIASSIHTGTIGKDRNASNGCIRVDGEELDKLVNYIGAGTKVYTLPEQKGSRFSLKGGRLHYIADNPYGKQEGEKKYYDDYNVDIDKSYSPLKLRWTKTGNEEYDKNVKAYAQAITSNKRNLQKMFNLTSDEYNHLAEMALGMAEQETKFGTAKSYKAKQAARNVAGDYVTDDVIVPLGRGIRNLIRGKNFNNHIDEAPSRGLTQLKLQADNEEMQELYKTLNVTADNIDNADKSAIATIARLAYMYNNEIKARQFTGYNNQPISPYDALLYKWNGHYDWLTNHTATPNQNNYINSVRDYANRFIMQELREYNKYKNGGLVRFHLDEVNSIM